MLIKIPKDQFAILAQRFAWLSMAPLRGFSPYVGTSI
jgi:hypothetical protein